MLDVYGTTAHDHWLMRVTDASGGRGSGGPTSLRSIEGGVEYKFESMLILSGPGPAPERISSEQVIDASSNHAANDYTTLAYESGGVTITDRYCNV